MAESSKQYTVYMERNQNHNGDYVKRVLMFVCEMPEVEASKIAQTDKWISCCGIWEEDIAHHVYQGLQRRGLSVVMTPDAGEDAEEDECDPRPRYPDGTIIEDESDLPRWYQ